MNSIATLVVLLLALGSTWTYPQDSPGNYEYPMDGPGDYEYEDSNIEEESNLDYDNLAVPTFTSEGKTYTVQEGNEVDISCAISAITPYVRIIKKISGQGKQEQLLFVGELEVKVTNKNKYNLNNGTMTIRNVNRDDAGKYMCYFEAEPVVELTHTLDVQYAPTVSSPTAKNQKVTRGDSVTLECEAKGNPVPNITWSRANSAESKEEEGRSMTLVDVDRHVEGTYMCKADNGVGKPATEEMTIAVEYAPEIEVENAVVRSGEGDKVELVCLVYSRPTAMVTWLKNGSLLEHEPNVVKSQGGHRHTLMLEKITEEMLGDYTCQAKNDNGEAETTIEVTELPSAPHFTSDPNGGEETSYTLTFETESYYPITEYQIKYKNAKDKELKNLGNMNIKDIVTKEKTHFIKYTIEGLEQATDYEVSAGVKNKEWSHESSFKFSTKKDKPQASTSTNGCSSLLGASTSMFILAAALLLNH